MPDQPHRRRAWGWSGLQLRLRRGLSIRGKILLGCLCLTLVTVLVGMQSRDAQSRLSAMAMRIYDEAFMSMSYLRSAQNTVLSASRDALAHAAEAAATATRLSDAIEDLEVARSRALSPDGAAAAAALAARVSEAREALLVAERAAGGVALLPPLERAFDEAVEVYAGDGFVARRAVEALVRRTTQVTWVAIGLSLATALVITALLSRAIVPSLRAAVGIAAAIAAGRLDNRIEASGADETGVLLRALASMQGSLAEKIARIEGLMAQQASAHATEIASQGARFEAAMESMTQGLCLFDADGMLLVHNRRFALMFGPPADRAHAHDALPAELSEGNPCGRMARSFSRTLEDGRTIAVVEGPMAGGGWVATYEDTTERHRVEARIAHMARHDALTGLPNRVLYREQMEHALPQLRWGGGLAVLCIDLDDFKSVNETLGHPAGDLLLRAAAERLLAETADSDMVVRLGGDEFAVIQPAAAQPNAAKVLAERLIAALSKPYQLSGYPVTLGASIGIAIAGDEDSTADGMLKGADLALYRAKADGRGTYRFFEAGMDARIQARRALEVDLREAVAASQFELYYQPLIRTVDGTVGGFEALVRWRHPVRGMVSPAEFIPLAEELGLIGALGSWVLNRACRDAVGWPLPVKVAVNLSPLQFREPDLAGQVATALTQTGLPAARLELEITESLLLQDSESTLSMLHQIKALGVRISMDDFGTGYSSLSYLRRFPFDKIKIDQSFIRNLEAGGDCIAIVRAVVGLGQSLGMSVIAEGVETEEQHALLRAEGCHQLQGYLFSPPRPAAEVAGLIERFSALPRAA